MAKPFKPGGRKGKLHRELGVPESETIPHDRLMAAKNSSDPEIRRDAIRADTMEHWHHGHPRVIPRTHKTSANYRGKR